ncbi:MAG TPA: T9SS type A sorting domain-containing protein, partial [Flavobacteriia bacterium]|nr:T9SS type A sorting domain-containing protein [Flavobacteriia bacterium]
EDASGTVLASGGSFTSVSTTNFCVGGAAVYGVANVEDTNTDLVEEVTIYPNPAKNSVTMSLRDTKMKTFSIINLLGQTVMQGDISDKTVNISNLKQGVYLIKFNSDKKQIIRRFIKE